MLKLLWLFLYSASHEGQDILQLAVGEYEIRSTCISPLMGIGRLPVTIATLMYAIDVFILTLRRATTSSYLT